MKTIILVWGYNYNSNGFWGIGDVIKGTIKMFQLSKRMNFKLIIDNQLHAMTHFLKKQNHEYESLILENKDNIPYIFPKNVENYILGDDKDVLYFITNDEYYDPVTEECKLFIKDLLTMNEEFSHYFEERKKEIPFSPYNILHFRLGDREMDTDITKIYENEFSILKNNLEKNDILLSDSFKFKDYVKKELTNNELFMFDTKIAHTGYCLDLESIKETLFEFFIITQSNKIKTYSVYNWTSGFVNIAREIYGVNII